MVGKGRLSKSSRSYSEREIDEEIGRRIRDLRVKAGYSQQRVGDHLHVSYQQVQKYEKGETRLSTAKLQQIADLFGVGIAHFFGDFVPGQSDIERLLQESTLDVETPAGRRIAQLLRYFRSAARTFENRFSTWCVASRRPMLRIGVAGSKIPPAMPAKRTNQTFRTATRSRPGNALRRAQRYCRRQRGGDEAFSCATWSAAPVQCGTR